MVNELFCLVNTVDRDPISSHSYFQDPSLLKKIYQTKSAQHYIRNGALIYQKSEGFCGSATKQCVLKSYDSFPIELIQDQTAVPSTPEKWCASLHELVQGHTADHDIQLSTKIIPGESYEDFLKTLRRLNAEPNTRIAMNYLRPALVGFQWPKYVPINLILGLLGGHFSPIIGFLEAEELVAVFDVNHKYGGTYLVSAAQLYKSVQAKDIMTGKCRGLVVLELQK